jgi:Raf kinase inhibitor-like YbhB/YbcL family protein
MHYLIHFVTLLLLQPAPLYIVSPDFEDGGSIPRHCTCDGMNAYPTLIVHGIPEGARSLTLVVQDAKSPLAPQWLAWNIPPIETLDEHTLLDLKNIGTMEGPYQGPCPENESVQTYAFHVYALDTLLSLPANVARVQLDEAMHDHILAKGMLQGNYSRSMVRGKKNK